MLGLLKGVSIYGVRRCAPLWLRQSGLQSKAAATAALQNQTDHFASAIWKFLSTAALSIKRQGPLSSQRLDF
jgi:hypothetical protein